MKTSVLHDSPVVATPAPPRAVNTAGVRRRSYRQWVRRASSILIACTAVSWLAYFAAIAWWPYPRNIAGEAPSATLILDRNNKPLAAFAAADGQWRFPLSELQISPHLLQAIIAVEDARFMDHAGIDWKSAIGAAWQNLTALRVKRGASTLTMQLHRLRDPRPRSLWAKIEQTIRARQIEKTTSKRDILVEYLNRAPFGGNLVGAGAASWRYFGKPCSALSLAEAALLAGLPKNPSQYRPDRFPQRAVDRRNEVLDRMLVTGLITPSQHDQAIAEPMRATLQPLPQIADRADGALPALLQLPPGQVLSTTLDSGIQREVFVATRDALSRLRPSGIGAVSVVVLDTTDAECLATASLSDASPKLNLARCPRSTGSVLKSFIYAAAFEAGVCTPASSLDDSPSSWSGYSPQDFDHTFRGQISAAEALADSRNIPAMQLLAKAGLPYVRGIMEAAGLDTLSRSNRTVGLTLAVGGAEATVMEVAKAYAALARGGIAKPVSLVPALKGDVRGEGLLQIEASNPRSSISNFKLEPPPQPSLRNAGAREPRFLTSSACWQVLGVLSDPNRTQSLCRAAARLNVAWKTGTSSNHRDAWCAAVTPRRTVVVWFGNADGKPSTSLVGQDVAAPLALELIASLDSKPAEWPTVASKPVLAAYQVNRPRLSIVSPAASREIVLNDDLPPEHQRVQLRASTADAVHWFIDGNYQSGDWWTPAAGSHEIRAVSDNGEASVVRVTVRPR